MKCAYYRWRISAALDCDQPQTHLPHAHMASCSACRTFHEQSIRLAGSLAQRADESNPQPTFKVSAARRWTTRGAGLVAAACFAAAVALFAWPTSQQIQKDRVATSNTPQHAPFAAPELPPDSLTLASAMESVHWLKDAAVGPLVLEMQQTLADAREVGTTLTNCLPFAPAAGPEPQDRKSTQD